MNNKNITQDCIKERKKFTAQFDRYDATDPNTVFLQLINIKDDRGNLIMDYLNISVFDVLKLIGNITTGRQVSFTAQMSINTCYPYGFKLINISSIEIL